MEWARLLEWVVFRNSRLLRKARWGSRLSLARCKLVLVLAKVRVLEWAAQCLRMELLSSEDLLKPLSHRHQVLLLHLNLPLVQAVTHRQIAVGPHRPVHHQARPGQALIVIDLPHRPHLVRPDIALIVHAVVQEADRTAAVEVAAESVAIAKGKNAAQVPARAVEDEGEKLCVEG